MIAQRLYCFLVVFLLMFLGTGFGQQAPGYFSAPKASDTARYNKFIPSEFRKITAYVNPIKNTEPVQKNFLQNMVPGSFYTSQLGVICKTELQLDKITTIPLRFRLGSLAYVNYLEQKPNATNPQR